MDKPKTTPRDFFLWTGTMVTFYWSVIAFILLVFEYINYTFPNALAYYPRNPYESAISYEMASIIVLVPLYLWLSRVIHRDALRDESRNEIWVRRWALLFTLFIAGVAIAGDLIILLTSFLSGEALTTAFILKTLVVLLVAAAIFAHFSAELKGYWSHFPARRNVVGVATGILALGVIVAGFFIVGTPQQARLARLDAEKVSDLQNIQGQVIYYWQAKRVLPSSLAELNDSLSLGGGALPVDIQSGSAYEYAVTGPRSFKLCAAFNTTSRTSLGRMEDTTPSPYAKDRRITTTWRHDAGTQCFEYTIDPSFYPPFGR